MGTGEVLGDCLPVRDGAAFLAFLNKAVKPHWGKDVHVVLDNLSTHTTPEVMDWLEADSHVRLHFTPKGASWINPIETWFGISTRQSIRRGTFTSVKVLIRQIRDYITHWNTTAELHLDRHHRRDPGQSPPRPDRHQKTRRQQRKVKTTESRDTSQAGTVPSPPRR